jgi:putative ABC transport system permease protein
MIFDSIRMDLRAAGSMLRNSPGFTAVAILTLAIGVGANTAIFSVVNSVLLRPLPFRDADALCLVTERLREVPVIGPSYQNLQDWRAQSHSFEQIAAARNTTFTLTAAGEPERVQAQMATWGLFSMLGVQAVEGRTFVQEEDRAGGRPAVLLSHAFWQSHFGGANVLGKSLTLDSQPYPIVGVLPPGYLLIQATDVVVPFEPWAAKLPDDRSWHPGIIAVGRLKPGVTVEKARAEIITIAARLEQQYPVYNTGTGTDVNGLRDQLVRNVRPALIVLSGAVALVLLIACANVANLQLARGNSRRREIALRTAIGAGRMRILRQLLTENLVLAFLGGLAGVAGAWAVIGPLQRLAGKSLPELGPIALDARVLAYSLAIVLFAALVFGLAPFFQSQKLDLRSALNEGGRGSTGDARQGSVRNLLVMAEIALAIVLLVGAGLLLRSFERLQAVPPGFTPTHLLVADIPSRRKRGRAPPNGWPSSIRCWNARGPCPA